MPRTKFMLVPKGRPTEPNSDRALRRPIMLSILRIPTLVACTLALAVMALSPSLFPQIDTGRLTGTVQDASGAVVPGAKIILTNVATGVKVITASTTTGNYELSGLIPGNYTVEAEASGFSPYVVQGIQVHVQQVLTIDIHFKTGSVQQQVTVTAEAPLPQAENPALGQTISNETVNDLPLATRDWGSLAQLSAGVASAPPGGGTADSGRYEGAYFLTSARGRVK